MTSPKDAALYLAESAGINSNGVSPDIDESLPTTQTNARQLRSITTESLEALDVANEPPVLFRRSGALARVRADENGRPIIDHVNESMLAGRLARAAKFVAVSKKAEYSTNPPQALVRDILALHYWPSPAFEGVVEVPTLRPNGTILATPG